MPKVAIIGASNNRNKYGNKSVRAYLKNGWQVFPVNPREIRIEGIKAYNNLSEIPVKIDRVSMYVPPQVGIKLLNQIAQVDPKEVFLNPGSESPELISRAHKLKLNIIQACSILELGEQPDNF